MPPRKKVIGYDQQTGAALYAEESLPSPMEDSALEPLPATDTVPLDEVDTMNGVSGDPYANEPVPQEVVNDVASMELPTTGMSFDFDSLNVQTRKDFDALPAEQQELLKAMKRGVRFDPKSAAEFILGQSKMRMEAEQKMRMRQSDPVAVEQQRKLKTEADVAQEAQAKSLQKSYDTADYMDQLLEKVKTHPGMDWSVGASSMIPKMPGSSAADFQVLLDQLGGQQFMQAYDTLKGGGQITEVEGKKATDAMARMNPRQSKEAFLEGVSEFQSIVRSAKERSAGKIPQGTAPASTPAQRPTKTVSGFTWEKGDDGKWYRKR